MSVKSTRDYLRVAFQRQESILEPTGPGRHTSHGPWTPTVYYVVDITFFIHFINIIHLFLVLHHRQIYHPLPPVTDRVMWLITQCLGHVLTPAQSAPPGIAPS